MIFITKEPWGFVGNHVGPIKPNIPTPFTLSTFYLIVHIQNCVYFLAQQQCMENSSWVMRNPKKISPFVIRVTLSFVPSKCLSLKRASVRLTRIFRRIIHWHRWPNTQRSIHKQVLSNLVLMIVYICFQRWLMPKTPLHHQKKSANRDKNKFATMGSTHQ